MGDVLWVTTRDGRAALRAVPAYLEVARRLETPEDWFGAVEHYERAARLARMLGRRAPVMEQALSYIRERALAVSDGKLSRFQYSLLSLLHELRFGDAGAFAAVCLGVALRSRDTHDLDTAKEFFGLAARFLDRAGDQAGADQARLEVGETLVLRAEAEERATNPAFAQHLWEEAVQAFRSFPGGKARLPELHRRLNACGREALKLMKPIGTTIDIRELVEIAREQVMGRTLPEAVCALAGFRNPPDPDEVRASVLEATSRLFFSNMFSSLTYDRHGRVVDRRPGLHGAGPEDEEKATDGLMQRDVDLRREMEVAGFIKPALGAILRGARR